MLKFFHHLFNPHCDKCELEKRHDPTIDILREVIEAERYNNKILLNNLLETISPKAELPEPPRNDLKPLKSAIPWRVQQQMLEAEDRAKAAAVRRIKEEEANIQKLNNPITPLTTEELEKELDLG